MQSRLAIGLFAVLVFSGCGAADSEPDDDETTDTIDEALMDSPEWHMASRINQFRKSHGKAGLKVSTSLLMKAAEAHSKDMALTGHFAHTSSSGKSMVNRICGIIHCSQYPSWTVGENIAWSSGYTDPIDEADATFDGWIHSAPHKANILDGDFTKIGLSRRKSTHCPGGAETCLYWTTDFFGK